MFNDKDTDRLISAMRAHDVTTLEIETKDDLLRLVLPVQPTATASAPPPPSAAPTQHAATSPDIGVFLPRGQDDGLSALAKGHRVQAHEVLGYVVRGAVRAAITAPCAGRLAEAPPAPGTIFGFGDPILQVELS